jgi:hypothetical protein
MIKDLQDFFVDKLKVEELASFFQTLECLFVCFHASRRDA